MNQKKIDLVVAQETMPLRLDRYLAEQKDIQSRTRAQTLIENQKVLVNGKPQKASYQVQPGDRIDVSLEVMTSISTLEPLDYPLDVIFEDGDLLVINKPAGLVVHPAAGHDQDTLVNALLFHTDDLSMKFGENRPGIVHRLDKDTSGILVVAKNDFSHEKLAQQFKERSIHRIYYCVVFGRPRQSHGEIKSYLARHPTHRKKYASLKGQTNPEQGKWAHTTYEVLKTYKNQLAYLKIKLHTGRTHQIRVHLSEMGLPILGDELYGGKKKSPFDVPRFALHAAELGFKHPRTDQNLLFVKPWPDDYRNLIQGWGLDTFQNEIS